MVTTEPVPVGTETPPESTTCDVGVQLIEPPDNDGVGILAQPLGVTLPTGPDRCPVLNLTPPWLALLQFVRLALTVAVLALPVTARGGSKVTLPLTAQVVGAWKVTGDGGGGGFFLAPAIPPPVARRPNGRATATAAIMSFLDIDNLLILAPQQCVTRFLPVRPSER